MCASQKTSENSLILEEKKICHGNWLAHQILEKCVDINDVDFICLFDFLVPYFFFKDMLIFWLALFSQGQSLTCQIKSWTKSWVWYFNSQHWRILQMQYEIKLHTFFPANLFLHNSSLRSSISPWILPNLEQWEDHSSPLFQLPFNWCHNFQH